MENLNKDKIPLTKSKTICRRRLPEEVEADIWRCRKCGRRVEFYKTIDERAMRAFHFDSPPEGLKKEVKKAYGERAKAKARRRLEKFCKLPRLGSLLKKKE